MNLKPEDYAALQIDNLIPAAYRDSNDTDRFPDDLIGATIVNIGSPVNCQLIEGGGLVIDYRPAGSDSVQRLVLGFTELGMWQEYPKA